MITLSSVAHIGFSCLESLDSLCINFISHKVYIVACCRDQAPWQQRAGNLASLVAGIGECAASRYTNFSENLWRVAVTTFNAVVELGLPAVNISYVNDEQPPGPAVWQALAHAFEG